MSRLTSQKAMTVSFTGTRLKNWALYNLVDQLQHFSHFHHNVLGQRVSTFLASGNVNLRPLTQIMAPRF